MWGLHLMRLGNLPISCAFATNVSARTWQPSDLSRPPANKQTGRAGVKGKSHALA